MATSIVELIDAAVAGANFGTAAAVQRGRNPKLPYVPVIAWATDRWVQGECTRQLKGAHATRDAAIQVAQDQIDASREELRRRLAVPNLRALRQSYGLPRELEENTTTTSSAT
jgi:hypothetical protein